MQESAAAPIASPVESELTEIRMRIEKGEFLPALQSAQRLAGTYPHNRDVLYSIGVCQRYLKRVPEALQTLALLQAQHPAYSRLYQERGYCRAALRDAPGAIESFLHAVNLNPALPGSWSMLKRLFKMVGDAANEAKAAAHVATLAQMPAKIVTANSMFADGDLAPAELLVRGFLLEHGDHVEAMRLLARIGLERDVLDDAELLLEAVVHAAPDYAAARFDYATVLLRRHRHGEALKELERLCASEPGNRAYRTGYAAALVGLGDHDRALEIYRELLTANPHGAELQLAVGHCLKTLGRTPEAIHSYRAAAAIRADYGEAYWSLANLKTYRFGEDEIRSMRAACQAQGTARADRWHLNFALGKAYEDRGAYAESFELYAQGNSLKRADSRYRAESIEGNTVQQIRHVTAEVLHRHRHSGYPDPSPIFILGLPRAGSTLLEQILASHSQIEGTMELADIPRMVLHLQGREIEGAPARYPAILTGLSAQELHALGKKYIDGTRIYRTGKPRFIDKMPNNFRHIGLISMILPEAKIIDARREPMACCFSNYKQLFAHGQEFTYSLEDIGRYYRTYLELMRHWDSVLPGRVLRVQHEEVVADLEGQVRRMLDFLELQFEPQCLEFHRTERSVRTASSEQVRRPLTADGLDQWRCFEPWLSPLREALAAPQNL
jgi:tetratricopeptide (TPR) repeat protein